MVLILYTQEVPGLTQYGVNQNVFNRVLLIILLTVIELLKNKKDFFLSILISVCSYLLYYKSLITKSEYSNRYIVKSFIRIYSLSFIRLLSIIKMKWDVVSLTEKRIKKRNYLESSVIYPNEFLRKYRLIVMSKLFRNLGY